MKLRLLCCIILVIAGCAPLPGGPVVSGLPNWPADVADGGAAAQAPQLAGRAVEQADVLSPLPYPERPRYAPGELVDYTAQSGDTLTGLAWRFNTSVAEILAANSFIPASATTMPPGMPMKIPIYYLPLWGSPYQIIPDSQFVNGPAQVGFDTSAFVNAHPGWLKNVRGYVSDKNRTGAEIIDLVAMNYSLSPRLLLALLEYQSGALSQPLPPPGFEDYPLGFEAVNRKGLFLQLGWAANQLNDAYYLFRQEQLGQITHQDGRVERIDPWQNAASVSLMHFFNTLYEPERYFKAIGAQGLAQTYRGLFGEPWPDQKPNLAGSLEQPFFLLPFSPGDVWALTGGPHTAWGNLHPYTALDFAPPSKVQGCASSDRWATAVADGVIVRADTSMGVMLDTDGDGDERTGWNVFYLHLASQDRVRAGTVVKAGQPLGHPSCEGGSATGTHVHIARKYNGEWMPAAGIGGGVLAFDLEGWRAYDGIAAYEGYLKRNAQLVWANSNANARGFIQSDRR